MVPKQERDKAQRASRLFKLASSPTRALILGVLSEKSQIPVQDIAKAVGMTHSAVSHQLGLLSRGKIVMSKKDGRTMRYSKAVSPESKALFKALSLLK